MRGVGLSRVSGCREDPDLQGKKYPDFSTANGRATEHVFNLPFNAAPTGDATIQVGMRGDYGSASEYATMPVNGDYMGTFDPGTECSADYAVKTFTVSQTELD